MANFLLILQQAVDTSAKSSFELVRDWVSFLFLIVGGSIAIRTYIVNQKQRRLENSFRLLSLFKESVSEDDLTAWENIFGGYWRQAETRPGYFQDFESAQEYHFSDLFSPGTPDGGATQRMAEQFELISEEILAKTISLRLIYFNLGQLMDITHEWLKTVENFDSNKSFLEDYYPNFDKVYKKHSHKFKKWHCKTYVSTC